MFERTVRVYVETHQERRMSDQIISGLNEIDRCWWPGDHEDYIAYHDLEWGRPVTNEFRLFEKICLEGFQAGLSWLTILRKREAFRSSFKGFNPEIVAKFKAKDVERLLQNKDIVRHRGKIESVINNAQKFLELKKEFDSFSTYIWAWEPKKTIHKSSSSIPASTEESTALSKDLKKRGWSFVGPTTMYAFMQSVGLVNDHLLGCKFHNDVEEELHSFKRPIRKELL